MGYADTYDKFAHESERHWAQAFDAHDITWQYEPFVFPLAWSNGKILRAFKPDFYLPDRGLFVEVTVMKQNLVTRKRNKVKTALATYPGIRIKLFTLRDYNRCIIRQQFNPEEDLAV